MSENYGRANAKALKQLEKIAVKIEALEPEIQKLSDVQLAEKTVEFKQRYQNGETLDELLVEAYAVCREAASRVLHQRHYHVQLLGGIALHQGRICQMATGEGKTLTETLPAYLNALSGKGVHIITVNEYLATRDKDWMGKVFKFLGLTVGVTLSKMTHREKQQAYKADITYGTNSEFGFDYLRDNMATSRNACVQRGLNFVIIDEVDSILIDEARTPLIISGPSGKSSQMYVTANNFACTLQNSTNVDEEGKTASENDTSLFGRLSSKMEGEQEELPNGDYVVDNKQKTVRLTDKGIAKAERYFKVENLFDPENTELNHYINNALKAHAIMHRNDDYIVEKGEVVIVDSFTGRKMEGRRFSQGLHQAIEAKERVTIKEEDRTLATITLQNFFRLYHKLSGMTGTAKTEEEEFNTIYNIDVVVIPTNLPVARIDRPDVVYSTRQGKLKAIVNEIAQRHQTGQPLLVGTITVEKSEELSALLKQANIPHNVLNAKYHKREAEIVAQAGRLGAVTIATNMAGRGTDILLGGNPEFLAKQEMKKQGYDDEQIEASTSFAPGDEETEKLKAVFADLVAKFSVETKAEKQKVVEAGGLCVIGTERHDSRRIDNQLRGRSGRQGDVGTSVFYISAEDDMVKIFASDMLQRLMLTFKFDEDTPIELKMFSRLIETAQKRIEGLHFSSRKNVLQYDDVNNKQRKVVFKARDNILDGGDVHEDILAMADGYARKALEDACDANENIHTWNLAEINKKLQKYFPVEEDTDILQEDDISNARNACKKLAELTRNLLDQRADKPVESDNEVPFREAERYVLLKTTDRLWMDHLDALDDLRQGVGLQAIAQHDPLQVYKKEAYELFENFNDQIKVETIRMLFFGKIMRVIAVSNAVDNSNINPERSLNGPCPCGSGKKYKNCCYEKEKSAQKADTSTANRPLTKKEEYALKREQRKQNKQNK